MNRYLDLADVKNVFVNLLQMCDTGIDHDFAASSAGKCIEQLLSLRLVCSCPTSLGAAAVSWPDWGSLAVHQLLVKLEQYRML